VMTFFFSIFYLQWAINKYVVGAVTRWIVVEDFQKLRVAPWCDSEPPRL